MRTRALLRALALDVLLPITTALLLVAAILGPLLPKLDRHAVGGATFLGPWDGNGTMWFHWWVAKAWSEGLPLLRPTVLVCPPGTCELGSSFPNRIDALLAIPFVRTFPLPLSFNLFSLAQPVAATWAGFFALRSIQTSRPLALVGGVLFGFNEMLFGELRSGRVVTALLAPLALTAGCWCHALAARSRVGAAAWGIATGLLGAICVETYAPQAIFIVVLALGIGLFGMLLPADGVGRLRPLAVGALAATVGIVSVAPYLYELLFVRLVASGSEIDPFTTPIRPWSMALWTRLFAYESTPGSPDVAALTRKLLANSMPLLGLWDRTRVPSGFGHISPGLTALLVAAALLGGARARNWLASSALLWVLMLGPTLCERVNHRTAKALLWEGYEFSLPMRALVEWAPMSANYLRPYRVFPVFLLALTAAGVLGAQRLTVHYPRLRIAFVAVFALLVARDIYEGRPNLNAVAWSVPKPVAMLAAIPGDFIVAEVPMGAGHATGVAQAVHGKRRTAMSQDSFDLTCRKEARPPSLTRWSPFLTRLWHLGAWDTVPVRPAEVEDARKLGIRYVLFFRPLYADLWCRDSVAAERALRAALGNPISDDGVIALFAVPDPSGDPAR
ncbi:MAG: hypothetical protein Q8P18_13050 [Pseudomonadota bacterium]|nr:hypothetical protein [Pseudomonadota bacterium]